jgi:hypothetical protein
MQMSRRRSRIPRLLSRAGADLGMTTAEYAVGTVAACGFGAALYKVVTSSAVAHLLAEAIRRALTLSF